MEARIEKTGLYGSVPAIPSKSMAHRCFLAAALCREKSRIQCQGDSEDIEATLRCLEALGIGVCQENGTYEIMPGERKKEGEKAEFLCGESGSTLRFLLPVAAALGISGEFYGEGRLMERPLSPLYEEMERHGCRLSPQGENPLRCEGKLNAGIYELPGDISSQYITGLLFALPLLEGESFLRLTSPLQSANYVDLTLQVLRQYGIEIRKEQDGYRIAGGQNYRVKDENTVEGDWSNAAFWLTAGAIGTKTVGVRGLNPDSLQGDKKILELLREMGAQISWKGSDVYVQPKALRGIEIDAADIPDLVPVLAAAASVAKGTTRICHAKRLRLKESDRLRTVSETLNRLGADVRELDDGLEIHGQETLRGGTVDAARDHRIAMTAAVAALVCREPVRILGAQAVKKSYPGFFEDYENLGGKVVLI